MVTLTDVDQRHHVQTVLLRATLTRTIILYRLIAEPAGKARQRSSIAKEIW